MNDASVTSIIGPNGAGKTTVFNAITGIYEPTAGTVQFGGRPLRKPLTAKIILACAAIGLLTALSGVLIMSDINALWRATIWRNNADPQLPFTYGSAWNDLWHYLGGGLDIEPRRAGAWSVVRADGRVIRVVQSGSAAVALEEQLSELVAGTRDLPPDGAELVLSDPTVGELARFEPGQLQSLLEEIRGEQRNSKRTAWFSFFAGLAIGTAGTYTVWNRSRSTPDVVAAAGIARTFQNIRLFASMTVLENLLVGMNRSFRSGPLQTLLRTKGYRKEEADRCREALELLAFVGLESKSWMLADNLAYGDQRRLEIARALATRPKLLLLDEPAAGMNPNETAALAKLIREIPKRGITVLLIEHHMTVVMQISDRVIVLDHGEKIADGTPDQVRTDPNVIEAYLGKEDAA